MEAGSLEDASEGWSLHLRNLRGLRGSLSPGSPMGRGGCLRRRGFWQDRLEKGSQ